MRIVDVRPAGAKKRGLAPTGPVTVVTGLDTAGAEAWAADLARALRGEGGPLEVEVEVEGKRQRLTPEVAGRLGLAGGGCLVRGDQLPGAIRPEPAPPASDPDALTAAVSAAEDSAHRLRYELADADRSAAASAEALSKEGGSVERPIGPSSVGRRLADAEAGLAPARDEADRARADLEAARQEAREAEEAAAAARAQVAAERDGLREQRVGLDATRDAMAARLASLPDPGDPAPVEQALDGLRRLRQVKPRPSASATRLADRWSAVEARLASLPKPPEAPQHLAAAALAALRRARAEAMAAGAASAGPATLDPARVSALEQAHREVVEAERAGGVGARLNRRRLEAARRAEQQALSALSLSSYADLAQRSATAPAPDDRRRAGAAAALGEAEKTWHDLHGGPVDAAWTSAMEEEDAVRAEAHDLLGRRLPDGELEAALRAHREQVVETVWAEQALVEALEAAGAGGRADDSGDLEAAAENWLSKSPARREARAALAAELNQLDQEVAVVGERLAERQEELQRFVGTAGPDAAVLATLASVLGEAEAVEAQRQAEVDAARVALQAEEDERRRVASLVAEATAGRQAVDDVRRRLREAEAEVSVATAASQEATAVTKAAATRSKAAGGADVAEVSPLEAELYLLARVSRARVAAGGPLPLVIDGAALSRLPGDGSGRALAAIGRGLPGGRDGSVQIVVVGGDARLEGWASDLGGATAPAVAR